MPDKYLQIGPSARVGHHQGAVTNRKGLPPPGDLVNPTPYSSCPQVALSLSQSLSSLLPCGPREGSPSHEWADFYEYGDRGLVAGGRAGGVFFQKAGRHPRPVYLARKRGLFVDF